MEQIVLKGLSKQYNHRWVIEDINQSFSCNDSYAFVGHNGCGKSTLLRLISGLTIPTGGSVEYSRLFRFSYVPEKFKPTALTGRAYLKRMCEIDRVEKKTSDQKTEKLAEDFFLSEMLDVPMKNLSKGTLQKIGVLQALIQEPDILLLDEPLSGQDQESQKVFIQKINALRDCGTTIFMSCHEKKIIDALANRIYTIEDKKLLPYTDLQKQQCTLYLVPKEKTIHAWENMKRYGAGYTLCTEEEKSQEVIVKLLTEGWILKGMYDENSQYGEI